MEEKREERGEEGKRGSFMLLAIWLTIYEERKQNAFLDKEIIDE